MRRFREIVVMAAVASWSIEFVDGVVADYEHPNR